MVVEGHHGLALRGKNGGRRAAGVVSRVDGGRAPDRIENTQKRSASLTPTPAVHHNRTINAMLRKG